MIIGQEISSHSKVLHQAAVTTSWASGTCFETVGKLVSSWDDNYLGCGADKDEEFAGYDWEISIFKMKEAGIHLQ